MGISITPEMVDAAAEELDASGLVRIGAPLGELRVLAQEVLGAALATFQQPPRTTRALRESH